MSNVRSIKSPCYHCTDRAEDCHSYCEKYAKFRKELDEYRDYKIKMAHKYDLTANAEKRIRKHQRRK